MAKNTIPGLKTGGGLLSKLILTAVALAVLVLVVKHPAEAASIVKAVAGAVGAIIDGISSFVQHLAQ
jgi:hypothetical protein